MCKFNNRLFVFSLLTLWACLSQVGLAKPALQQDQSEESGNLELNDLMALSALLAPQDNYDLHYDQRQKGNENYRVKLDGFFIGLPQEDGTSLLLLTDDLVQSFGDDLISSDADANKKPSMFELDQYQKSRRPLSHMEPQTPLASAAAAAVVEIPAPNKHLEARHYDNDAEDMPNRPKFRPRSYVSHLLNLFGLSKRGGGGGHRN